MPHYITVRIDNAEGRSALTEKQLKELSTHVVDSLQDLHSTVSLGVRPVVAAKLGDEVTLFEAKSYGAEDTYNVVR